MTQKEKFKAYLAIETAGGADWHPKEKKITFEYDNPGYFQVYTVPIQNGIQLWPERISHDIDRCTDARYLSDESIVFLGDQGGKENFQIGVATKDKKLEWITNDKNAKHLITLTTDDYIYFSANLIDKSIFAIYRHKIPLLEYEPELLFQPDEGYFLTVLVSPNDENKLILRKYLGNNHQELLLFDIESREIVDISKVVSGDEKIRWDAVRWLDDEHLLVITDYESDYFRLAIISLEGNFIKLETLDKELPYDIEKVAWSTNSDITYFVANQKGYSKLFKGVFISNRCENYSEIKLPFKGVITAGDIRTFTSGMTVSPDGTMIALTITSPNSPTNIWIYSVQSNSFWKATNTDTAGLNKENFVDCTLVQFSSFDNLSVPYFRYLPTGSPPSKGWPAILIIHGGPEAQIRPSFSAIIQFFLSAGYAIITPNIRGSTGYGKKYLDLDNIEKRLDSIRDISELVSHLKKTDLLIDSDRLVVMGASYGGFAVLSAMTEYPELWKAGIDIVGIANFITFLQNTASWRRKLREVEYGSLKANMDTLTRISPIHKVNEINAPLFIVHGDNDERVPLSETIQMYNELREKNLNVKLLRFSDEGHGVTKLRNRIKTYSEILEWLNQVI